MTLVLDAWSHKMEGQFGFRYVYIDINIYPYNNCLPFSFFANKN